MVRINNISVLTTLIMILSLLLLPSCGGPPEDYAPGSGRGKVVLFLSDNISFYKQVVATITSVRLINSGTGEVCEVLGSPVTVDIANLTDIAWYANLADCAVGRYNRIDIALQRDVRLMNQLDVASSCSFAAALDESGAERPLDCDQGTGICTASIRGGSRDVWVQVQEDRHNDLGIDFDLKKFTVRGFGDPSACSVTLSASTLSAGDIKRSGRAHSITGGITALDIPGRTFTLVTSHVSLTIDYARVLPALQPNLDLLLQKAQDEGLRVNVRTGGIDLQAGTLPAGRICVKAAGTVSAVTGPPQWTFTLSTGPSLTIAGSHRPPAAVQGTIADGAWVNVQFDGFHSGRMEYLAASIELLSPGTVLDD